MHRCTRLKIQGRANHCQCFLEKNIKGGALLGRCSTARIAIKSDNCSILSCSCHFFLICLNLVNPIWAVFKFCVDQLISCQKCWAIECQAIPIQAVNSHSTTLGIIPFLLISFSKICPVGPLSCAPLPTSRPNVCIYCPMSSVCIYGLPLTYLYIITSVFPNERFTIKICEN